MARGIEELAEMQVTGPVQGGDMVMKPDQAPVGAAALLNKMSRQNTPGIFKLPMPDKQMPDFMKVAAEGVEQQISQGGDTISTMAGELLRQGFDPIVIKGMDPLSIQILYERTFGSERDADELSSAVQDLRNKVKTVETFAPEDHQLAYITPKEGEMLKLLGGSGETNPITGIKQYPEVTQQMAEEQYGVSPSQWAQGFSADEEVTSGGAQDQPSIAAAIANIDAQESYEDTQNIYDQLEAGHSSEAINESIQTGVELPETPEKGPSVIDALTGLFKKGYRPYLDTADAFAGGVADWEEAQVQKLLEGSVKDTSTGMGNLLYTLGKDEDRFEDWFAKRGDIFDEVFEKELESKEGQEGKELTDQEKFDFLVNKYSGNKQFKKTYNPKEYFKSKSGESTADYQRRMREKGVTAAELAQAQAEGKLGTKDNPGGFTRANTMMIQEGRDLLSAEQDRGQDRHPGTGIPVEKITEEEEIVTTTTDPKAGAFNLGGTMPYTHDVATGGVEMDVPLGRRFQIGKDKKYRGTAGGMDLNEAMQYATLGGYGQLEPFQEYLTRRRKHLGEDEPQYFDEEGNVIYSGTEIT
jgi:hypothetical protein